MGQALEHLYIHVPFCSGRCNYCAFVSGMPPKEPARYVEALVAEARQRALTLAPLQTLYMGGGTPGLLGEAGFRRLAAAGLFRLQPGGEWSVELHPKTVSEALVETLAELGVTRLSIGVQSFDDEVLKRCNRRHSAREALAAIACARRVIPDTGIDLIAGLPGVDAALWRETLRQALTLALPHLSIYALSIEAGSRWEGLSPPEPEALCNAVAEAAEALAAAGYLRYETSNYARPGFCCRHNLNTWHGGDYVGLGRGACSRLGRLRRDGQGREELLSAREDALERALTQLRLAEGFRPQALAARFPALGDVVAAWERQVAQFRAWGLLNEAFAPTLRGYEVLDAMERELLAAAL